VYKYDEITKQIEIEKPLQCTFCNECVQKAENLAKGQELVSVQQRQDRFIFTVESTGALRPEEIIFSAFNVIKQKLRNIRTQFMEGSI
jgi:DNA-directed RNA polymerase II subunit RPB3